MSEIKNDNVVGFAIEKLKSADQKKGAKSQKAQVVYPFVRDTIIGFCQQNSEFAEAVVQTEKTLGECCEEVMKGTGNHIDDLKVYARSAAFYFPGCEIDMKMTIRMSKFEREEASASAPKAVTLDLFDPLELL